MIGCQSVSSSKYLQLWVSVTPGSPTPVPPTVRAGITKRRKENYKNILFNKASLPPPHPVPWRTRAQTAATRAQAAAGLIPDVMLPAPPPPPGSLIDKELTQYDALIDRWANVTTRRQETLRCLGCLRSLYDSHIVGLEAGGGGRADPQLLGLEAGGGGRADPQLLGRDLHPLRKRNFSVWSQQRLCRSSTSRP